MKIIEDTSEWSGRGVSWFFLMSVLVVFYEVVARYFLNAPSTWGFELSLYGSAAAIIVAGAYCTKTGAHIAVTLLQDNLPPRVHRSVQIFNVIFAAVVCALMAGATAEWGWTALSGWQRTGSAWNPPAPALVKPLIPITFAMMFLQNMVTIYRFFTPESVDESEK